MRRPRLERVAYRRWTSRRPDCLCWRRAPAPELSKNRSPRHQGGGLHHFLVQRPASAERTSSVIAAVFFSPRYEGEVEPIDSVRCTSVSTSSARRSMTAESFQTGEARSEQDRLVTDPIGIVLMRPGVGLVACADVLPDFVPGIRRYGGRGITEERHRAGWLDQSVETLQRVRPVHPVEGAAHDDQLEQTQGRAEIVGTAGDKVMFAVVPASVRAAASISGVGSIATTSRASGANWAGKRTGTAAKVERPVLGLKASDLGDPANERPARKALGPVRSAPRRSGSGPGRTVAVWERRSSALLDRVKNSTVCRAETIPAFRAVVLSSGRLPHEMQRSTGERRILRT